MQAILASLATLGLGVTASELGTAAKPAYRLARSGIRSIEALKSAAKSDDSLLSPTYNAALHHVSMATSESRP